MQNFSLQHDAALQVYMTVRTAVVAGRPGLHHLPVPEATQLLLILSWLSCCCVILHIFCFAATPPAGALLADPRQPPTSASSIRFNAAADIGTLTCHAVSWGTMYHKRCTTQVSPNIICFSCLPHCVSLNWHVCILCPDDDSVPHPVICMGSIEA